MPSRGQARYSTAMPSRLISSMCAWKARQNSQFTSVNTMTLYFGFGGENTMPCPCESLASSLLRNVAQVSWLTLRRLARSISSPSSM
jgi:hypothetical protein